MGSRTNSNRRTPKVDVLPIFPAFCAYSGTIWSFRVLADRLERGTLEDVALRDLHRVEAEHLHRLGQDHTARNDRRRPVRMKPRHPATLLQRQRRQLAEDALAGRARET